MENEQSLKNRLVTFALNHNNDQPVETIKKFLYKVDEFALSVATKLDKTPSVSNDSFNKFSRFNLPIYLLYIIKKYQSVQDTGISITNYENLLKESKYADKRKLGQMIIMWRKTDKNFRILSYYAENIVEDKFDEKAYFLWDIDCSCKDKYANSWKEYSLAPINKIKLMTLHEAVVALQS